MPCWIIETVNKNAFLFANFMEKKLMNLVRNFPKEIKKGKFKFKKLLYAKLPLSHLQGNYFL